MSYLGLDIAIVQSFTLFSRVHLLTLVIIVLVILLLYLSRDLFKLKTIDQAVRYFLAGFLIFLEASLEIYDYLNGTWSIAYSLPLQLCSILVMLSALMLVTKSYRLYEFVYLLGIAGSTQALITPDLGFNFPQFGFFQFFISHALIVISALYMTFVHNYRPYLNSIYRTFITLNLIVPFIVAANFLTGGDYFFLAAKPASASLLDYMGPWPWYIISLEFVAIGFLFLVYLPFLIKDFQTSKKT